MVMVAVDGVEFGSYRLSGTEGYFVWPSPLHKIFLPAKTTKYHSKHNIFKLQTDTY